MVGHWELIADFKYKLFLTIEVFSPYLFSRKNRRNILYPVAYRSRVLQVNNQFFFKSHSKQKKYQFIFFLQIRKKSILSTSHMLIDCSNKILPKYHLFFIDESTAHVIIWCPNWSYAFDIISFHSSLGVSLLQFCKVLTAYDRRL